jgi:hypothetical protein
MSGSHDWMSAQVEEIDQEVEVTKVGSVMTEEAVLVIDGQLQARREVQGAALPAALRAAGQAVGEAGGWMLDAALPAALRAAGRAMDRGLGLLR